MVILIWTLLEPSTRHTKTDVTLAILSHDYVTLLYRATKLQHATVHIAQCDIVA